MPKKEVWFQCEKTRFYGELHIPNSIPASAVLICHGMNSQGFHYLKIYDELADALRKEGFVSFVFDFRGVGKSEGQFDYGFGEQEDVKCALACLSSRPESVANEIFVVGHSLGGAVSLYALRNEARAKGLVLWSTPMNHNYNVKKFIKRTRGSLGLYVFLFFSWIDKLFDVSKIFRLEVYGVNLKPKLVREKLMRLNECEAISKLHNLPVLVVIGNKDVIVGEDEAREVYASANEPKDLLVIEGADHVYKGKESELISKTVNWIKSRVQQTRG